MSDRLRTLVPAFGFTLLGLWGCGSSTSTPTADAGPAAVASPDAAGACVPDRAQWASTVLPVVQRACGSCHGAAPQYGAPFSLLDYDFDLQVHNGFRTVDRMAARLVDGSMPPAGTPAPSLDDVNAIAGWASCGARTVADDNRLRASAPLFRPPATPPADVTTLELRADNFAVPLTSDRYQCFGFDLPVTEDRFVRRFDVLLDHPEVVHHAVLFRDVNRTYPQSNFECPPSPVDSFYTYTWAPGQDALQFPDGGLRVRPGDRYLLQIHYNNSRSLPNIVDRSGVRLSLGATTGTEYGMIAVGPTGFSIPARQQMRVASGCALPAGTRVLAVMPHMHQTGLDFEQYLLRGGARTPLVTIENWEFGSQFFYDTPLTFQDGDRVETACTYNNTTSSVVNWGARTTDEMCFSFSYVTPPPADEYCNQPLTPTMPTAIVYAPGMCSPAGAPTALPLASGLVQVGPAPTPAGGAIPDGRWELTNVQYIINMTATSFGTVDTSASVIQGRGQLWTSAGRLRADVMTALSLAFTSGLRTDRALPTINFDAAVTASGSTLTLAPDCSLNPSATPSSVQYEVHGQSIAVTLAALSIGTLQIIPQYTFHLATP